MVLSMRSLESVILEYCMLSNEYGRFLMIQDLWGRGVGIEWYFIWKKNVTVPTGYIFSAPSHGQKR